MFDYEVGYTYLTTDLRYNTILAELSLSNVQYSHKLSSIGAAQGSLYLDPELDHDYLHLSTYPGRTGLYILRNEIPVWGGIIWKRAYDSTNGRLALQAETFESYYERYLQLSDYNFQGYDQFAIAQTVCDAPNQIMKITQDKTARSGVMRDRTMQRTDYATVYKELSDLASLENGFDFNIAIGLDQSGAFTRRLDLGYPSIGVTQDSTPFMFEYPGNISSFSASEDADGGANYVLAVGEKDEETNTAVESIATDADSIAQGWPTLQTTRSYSSVVYQDTLKAHAVADLARLKTPIVLYSTTVRAEQDPQVGSYRVGDWGRFRIENEWVTPLIDVHARITEFAVTVDDRGGPESVALTLGGGDIGARGDSDAAV